MNLRKCIKNYGSLYFACNDKKAVSTFSDQSLYALSYLLDNMYIRFETKLYRQIVGIPMGTKCAPFVADLFFYTATKVILLIYHGNQADVIEA